MKITLSACIAFAFVIISNALFAEKAPIKFGKISKEEIEMVVYEPDSSASAVILYDYGISNYKYNESTGFDVVFTRNIRIKILNKNGYEWAKREIMLYEKWEDLVKLKAYTFNYDDDGKEIKVKLEKNEIYKEKYNRYWDLVKFEMPQIKEGSIIDIEYTINAGAWGYIRDWYFQSEIPTIQSKYEVTIPEYFIFKQLQKGYLGISLETKKENSFLTYTNKERGVVAGLQSNSNQQTQFKTFKVDFSQNKHIFTASDVPAFHKEKHLTSMENYLSSIHFELGSYQMPMDIRHPVTASWEGISEDLLKYEDFGTQINRGGFLKDKIEEINNQELIDEEKLALFYFYIQQNMTWDGLRGIYSNNISKAWNEKNGSCGDINLMLLAGLKKMGFEADPVILSTRDNGFIHPGQIMLDQFNYVVASVTINDKTILLDATDKFISPGTLPKRCLNQKGRLIASNGGLWVEIHPSGKFKKAYQTDYSISEEGIVSGTMKEVYYNYAAINKRTNLQYHNSIEDYMEEYQKDFTGAEIVLDSITGKDDMSKPVTIRYQFESENMLESAGNLLLINPFLCSDFDENPYKLERRDYPVDYSYPQSLTYFATISIPDNYSVEELPKAMRIAMPEKSALFTYSVQNMNGKLILVSKFRINKVTFLPQEYDMLKEFYNRVIEAHSHQIVLKKI